MLCHSLFDAEEIAVNLIALSPVSVNTEAVIDKGVLYDFYGLQIFSSPAFLPRDWSKDT